MNPAPTNNNNWVGNRPTMGSNGPTNVSNNYLYPILDHIENYSPYHNYYNENFEFSEGMFADNSAMTFEDTSEVFENLNENHYTWTNEQNFKIESELNSDNHGDLINCFDALNLRSVTLPVLPTVANNNNNNNEIKESEPKRSEQGDYELVYKNETNNVLNINVEREVRQIKIRYNFK